MSEPLVSIDRLKREAAAAVRQHQSTGVTLANPYPVGSDARAAYDRLLNIEYLAVSAEKHLQEQEA